MVMVVMMMVMVVVMAARMRGALVMMLVFSLDLRCSCGEKVDIHGTLEMYDGVGTILTIPAIMDNGRR